MQLREELQRESQKQPQVISQQPRIPPMRNAGQLIASPAREAIPDIQTEGPSKNVEVLIQRLILEVVTPLFHAVEEDMSRAREALRSPQESDLIQLL